MCFVSLTCGPRAELLDVAETKLNVPKLFEANEHVSGT